MENRKKTPKILIVDDEPDFEGMVKLKMRKHIRQRKYDFLFANNGLQALEIMKSNDIDVVVSDINMPEMDGITMLSKMNSIDPNIKTIIVSAYGDMDNIRAAMNHGANDYMIKPIDFDNFELTLNKTIEIAEKIKKSKRLETEAKKRLKQAYEKEKQLSDMKTHFLSLVSHEYRNPLTIIQSSSDVIKSILNSSEIGVEAGKFIAHIDSSVRKMTNLIDDVLRYENIEAYEVMATDSPVTLSSVIRSIVYESEITLNNSHKIVLNFNDESIKAKTDETLLFNIISNLLSNAVKYSQGNSEIRCDVEFGMDEFSFTITDEGTGITDEELSHLFEPFQRGHNSRKLPGTGLGLSIVKRCVDKLNGRIKIETKLEKGTKVSVTLPYLKY